MIRFLFLIIASTLIRCNFIHDDKPIFIHSLKLDTIDCCSPNQMGCTPCGRMLISKEPITNELYCMFLNSENIVLSDKRISNKNGRYSVDPGWEQEACNVPSIKIAQKFTTWYNKKYNDQYGKSDSNKIYQYGNFELPNSKYLEKFKKYGNFKKSMLQNGLVIDSLGTSVKNANLFLVKFEKEMERTRGVEF